MNNNFCTICGTPLTKTGDRPWQSYFECNSGHKFELTHGDRMGGASDQTILINKYPSDMKVYIQKPILNIRTKKGVNK